MKIKEYIIDKITYILISLFVCVTVLLLFLAFKINLSLIIAIFIILISEKIIILIIDYNKKNTFLKTLMENVQKLDKAYLVLETLKKPTYYEGIITYDIMYEINKSMLETIKKYETELKEFKNYIEMWIHEIKVPVSSLTLLNHNHKDKFTNTMKEQMKKIDDYLEQVLYYVRSENTNSDYLIQKTNLKKCINTVALKNKDAIFMSNIALEVAAVDYEIYTDAKWLEFILSQIINNSIKYIDKKKNSYIKIYTYKNNNTVTLVIEDNGIGIDSSDIKRVFEKSFTGINGRKVASSTGMGLFIAKNLCEKLGHNITLESKKNSYTKVSITFKKDNFYDVLK